MSQLSAFLGRARNARLLLASVVTGVVVATIVAGFELLASDLLLDWLLEQELWVLALAPVVGITAAKVILRFLGRNTSGSTSDEYIRAFHERQPRIPISELPGKLLAGVATIGAGGAMGLEGPSIYAGSSVGLFVHERLGKFFRRDEARILLTRRCRGRGGRGVQGTSHRSVVRARGPLPRRRDSPGTPTFADRRCLQLRHLRLLGGNRARGAVPRRGGHGARRRGDGRVFSASRSRTCWVR